MAIFLLIVVHWYASLFFQSFFHHRYAAHRMFTMSRGWEKFFYWCCFVTQGSSYISASSYGIMHRLHHAHTDTEEDPHSPMNSPNLFLMMWDTRNSYYNIFSKKVLVDEKFKKDLPEWPAFDKMAHNWITRVAWAGVYSLLYIHFATHWWEFLFLPITFAMGSFQGAVVNWWAHRFGYENFHLNNTSKNIVPVDLFFWGEAYHNNHHKHPGRPDNAIRWFEFDSTYMVMRLLNKLRVIRLKKPVGV